FGRRGGRHRGDRQQGGPGGRNLPPSKYASPQSGEFRGYANRGGQQPGYDNRRQEGPRSSGASPADLGEETIVLPGESLAKYRDKAAASPAAAPIADQGSRTEPSVGDESSPRPANTPPVATSGSGGVPRRFSGGLPSWLLAEAGEEPQSENASGLSAEEVAELEARRAADRADFAADVAQETAEHAAALGEHQEVEEEQEELEGELGRAESEAEDLSPAVESLEEPAEGGQVRAEAEVISASGGEPVAEAAVSEEAKLLLPGETRGPRTASPRDSARIGGNPRSRFQRPFRRDRGGRPDRR